MSGTNIKTYLAVQKVSHRRGKSSVKVPSAKNKICNITCNENPTIHQEAQSEQNVEEKSTIKGIEELRPTKKRDGKSILEDFVIKEKRQKICLTQAEKSKSNNDVKQQRNASQDQPCDTLQREKAQSAAVDAYPTPHRDVKAKIKTLTVAEVEQSETLTPPSTPTKKRPRSSNNCPTPDQGKNMSGIIQKPVTFKSPSIDPMATIPAYKMYAHLRPMRPLKLRLPDKFEVLYTIFGALDYVLIFCKGQNTSTPFVRLKKPVENMCRRTTELRHLSQIKTIFPSAYTYQPVSILHEGQRVDTHMIDFGDWQSPSETNKRKRTANEAGLIDLPTNAQLDERKGILRQRLHEIVKKEHDVFLESLPKDKRPVATSGETLVDWHPSFNFDNVPDISESELPKIEKPIVDTSSLMRSNEKGTSAKIKSTLAKLNSYAGVDKQATNTPQQSEPQQDTQSNNSGGGIQSKSKCSALLERIRAKEKKRIEEAMYQPSPEQSHRKLMLSRLPTMVDSISFLFKSMKKNVMFMPEIALKLSESYNMPLSIAEATAHIDLLAEIVPTYVKVSVMGCGKIVKIDQSKTIMQVKTQIQDVLNAM